VKLPVRNSTLSVECLFRLIALQPEHSLRHLV
jgi:hypothetical protein